MTSFRDAFAILQVADVAASLRFYRDELGFRIEYAFPDEEEPQFVALEIEGGKLALGQARGAVESGSAAVWLYTDDVDAAFAELRQAGAPVVAEPEDQPWGERVAAVADPDGYTVYLGAAKA